MAHRWSGNPYLRLSPMERLTDDDWAALSDGDKNDIREATHRLYDRGVKRGEEEVAQRAKALLDRFGGRSAEHEAARQQSIDDARRSLARTRADMGKPAVGVKAPGASDEDRKIAEAESRVAVTRDRLARAQSTFDRASHDPKADALAEHFPLGVGGSGGGRQGSTDAQLRRYVEARQSRDAAQSQHVRAEAQLKELTARRSAAGKYDRSTVSAGDAIKVDGSWWRVQKANEKTVQVDAGPGMDVKYRWDRVTDHRPAKALAEQKPVPASAPARALEVHNPVGDPKQRAAYMREHANMTRDQFNVLDPAKKDEHLTNLRTIVASEDRRTRAFRDSMGSLVRGGEAEHVAGARSQLSHLTRPEVQLDDRSPAAVVARIRTATNEAGVRAALRGNRAKAPTKAELEAIAREGGWHSALSSGLTSDKMTQRIMDEAAAHHRSAAAVLGRMSDRDWQRLEEDHAKLSPKLRRELVARLDEGSKTAESDAVRQRAAALRDKLSAPKAAGRAKAPVPGGAEQLRPNDAHEFTMPAERSSRPVQAGDRVKHGTSTGKVLRLERKYGIDGAVVTTDGELKYPNWMPLAQIHVKPAEEDAKKLAAEAAAVREQQARNAVEREAAQAAAAEQTVRAAAARQALAGTPALQLRSQGKKGDLAILETETSSFTVGRGHERQKEFSLVRVAGTNRAGVPTSYHNLRYGDPKPGDQPIKVQPRYAYQHSFHVIPPGSVNEQGAIEAARANRWHVDRPADDRNSGKPFESLDEARVAFAPHVTPTAVLESTGPIKAKPAGKDWEKVPSLIPRPRRGSGGLAPKAPDEVSYAEPTGLAPGAKVAWTHHHENGTTSQRTGRVWDAAPGTNSAWVVPDERKPGDPYSAIVVKPEGRGGKLVSHDSTNHITGNLAHAAAEQAHIHRYGPKPMPFTPASIEEHIKESASELGVPSGLTHQYGMTRSDNNTLEQLLRGFNRNTPAEHRTTPMEAVQRLRDAAALYNRNVVEADARSFGNLDDRYRNWQDMAKLYTKIADRIEADWNGRVARARTQGLANKSTMGTAEFTKVLRTAELVWMSRTGQLLAMSA